MCLYISKIGIHRLSYSIPAYHNKYLRAIYASVNPCAKIGYVSLLIGFAHTKRKILDMDSVYS